MYIVTEQQNIAELLMMSDKNRSWTERLLKSGPLTILTEKKGYKNQSLSRQRKML